jgi:hypothetical protein
LIAVILRAGTSSPTPTAFFSQLNLPRLAQIASSAIHTIAFLILFTLSNSNQHLLKNEQ